VFPADAEMSLAWWQAMVNGDGATKDEKIDLTKLWLVADYIVVLQEIPR
jgi:hypothetical protein